MIYFRQILAFRINPRRIIYLIGMICLGLMLSACGQKGPLFLPTTALSAPLTTPESQSPIAAASARGHTPPPHSFAQAD